MGINPYFVWVMLNYLIKFLLMMGVILFTQTILLAQDKVDTLIFRGKCQYVGKTYSHLATTYFRFKVVEVIEGTHADDFIVFEGTINSRQHQLFSKIKEGKKLTVSEDEVSKIFPIRYVRVSDVFKCTSKIIEIKVQKSVEWPDRQMLSFVPEYEE